MKTGIITKPAVWLYGRDEEKMKITDQLMMGWAVGILEENEHWLKVVTHYGYPGYLRKNDISMTTKRQLMSRDVTGEMAVIRHSFADVMESPRVRARIAVTLSRGAFVRILPQTEYGYQKVELSDQRQGYLPCSSYTSRRDNDGYLYGEQDNSYFLRQRTVVEAEEETLRRQLVDTAKIYRGMPYRWGGKTSMGIDCSGLTFMAYQMCGILIYRDAAIHPGYPVREISRLHMRPGDLLYFPGHVAMYIGKNRYIHSTGNPSVYGCVINSLSKSDCDYRQDLAEQILAVGSIFPSKIPEER